MAVRVSVALVTLALFAALATLGGLGATPSASAASAGAVTRTRHYYVSLGDSYAIGFQPAPSPGPTPGYTAVVARATHMTLVNFGCGGATTTSILETDGCAPPGTPAGEGVVHYPHRTQAAAAVAFIRSHRRHIGLITVSIGGNDVTDCVAAADPTTCVLSAVRLVEKHVAALAKELRKAAGSAVPLIGLSYPDVILGTWVYPAGHPERSLAGLSVTAFKDLLNPALEKAYRAAHGAFVDVTKDTGGYLPLSETTTLPPYGTVPDAVARVCRLTWFCTQGNIHAKTAGYTLIGREILARYRSLRKR